MGERFELWREVQPGVYAEVNVVGSYDTCIQAAARLHDAGDDSIFWIEGGVHSFRIASWTLEQESCPICGKKVRRYQMEQTHDCHGIPFRMVCGACYDRLMDEKGYDGEEYDEADECLDYNY